MSALQQFAQEIKRIDTHDRYGYVKAIVGLTVEVSGLDTCIKMGGWCEIATNHGDPILAEVVGFKEGVTLLMPYEPIEGIGPGNKVRMVTNTPAVYPDGSWLGRVLDSRGRPIDNKGDLSAGTTPYTLHAQPIKAHLRQRVGSRLNVGVRSINTFITTCRGQRLGIFAGSGVGKSVLMSMITRFTEADVVIIGLVGERGREVYEFLEDNLDAESLARSIVVVATSDETAMQRKSAAYLTLTLAEYFRDQGKEVLCMIDSVTRFAMAQREIGLSAGEPPASKGYTPTVFSELPKLLERAGPGGAGQGNITGIFTVLVEGDDHNEPISDAVRGILDGHIVLERKLAERGHFPAINILKSISRTMPDCNSEDENELIRKAKGHFATYTDMEDMIRLGAYRAGSDPAVDAAMKVYPGLCAFLTQRKQEQDDFEGGFQKLAEVVSK